LVKYKSLSGCTPTLSLEHNYSYLVSVHYAA